MFYILKVFYLAKWLLSGMRRAKEFQISSYAWAVLLSCLETYLTKHVLSCNWPSCVFEVFEDLGRDEKKEYLDIIIPLSYYLFLQSELVLLKYLV